VNRRLPDKPKIALLAVAMLVTLLAPVARAFEIATVTVARDESGQLWVTTRLDEPIEPRVEKSLERGMPATLMLHAELWRHRTGWFDRMEHAADAIVRLRHDIWHEEWRLERSGAAPLRMRDVDSLVAALSRPLVLEVPGLESVPEDGRCYVVVTATVKPLSVEDAEEVEGWVSGEVRDQRHAGFGVITQLPRSLFDAVRNFTGFGDSRDQSQTPEFRPGGLPVVRNLR
jgi:hypothetical protein